MDQLFLKKEAGAPMAPDRNGTVFLSVSVSWHDGRLYDQGYGVFRCIGVVPSAGDLYVQHP